MVMIACIVCYYKYYRNLARFKTAKINCYFRKQQVSSASGELDMF